MRTGAQWTRKPRKDQIISPNLLTRLPETCSNRDMTRTSATIATIARETRRANAAAATGRLDEALRLLGRAEEMADTLPGFSATFAAETIIGPVAATIAEIFSKKKVARSAFTPGQL